MKKTLTLLIALALIMGIFNSCKKKKPDVEPPLTFDDYKLPIINNGSSNYFGYLLDGEPIWRQNGVSVVYSENEPEFYLNTQASDGKHAFSATIPEVLEVGKTYQLKEHRNDTGAYANYYYYTQMQGKNPPITAYVVTTSYISTDNNPGFIKILFIDKKKMIISGIFELQAQKYWATEIRKITQGRFNVTYRAYRPIML
jgi:hypothetical protein